MARIWGDAVRERDPHRAFAREAAARHAIAGAAQEPRDLRRDLPCEWCVVRGRSLRRPPLVFEELHHIIGGAGGRCDEDWNVVAICTYHHRHPTHGFHGSNPSWNHERAFQEKLALATKLPPDAWAYLARRPRRVPDSGAVAEAQPHRHEPSAATRSAEGQHEKAKGTKRPPGGFAERVVMAIE